MSTGNIAADIIVEHINSTGEKAVDIYRRMGISKNAFHRLFRSNNREPTMTTLAKLRKGLRWRKDKFWTKVLNEYDTKAKK